MARIRNGILGGFANKVGEVIGQNYAGVSTMRAMPKYVANPRTPAQEAHRAKMALAGSFLSAFNRGFSFSSWNKSAVNNGFNGALCANLYTFVDYPNAGLEVDLLALDMGTYLGVPLTTPTLVSALLDDVTGNIELEMTWDVESKSEWASDNDTIILFAAVEHQEYEKGQKYTPLYCDVLPEERVDGGSTAYIYAGDTIAEGDYVYVALGVVADSAVCYGRNPQKPSETIKIPAKNVIRTGKAVPKSPTTTVSPSNNNVKKDDKPKQEKPPETIKIPAKNVVRFSAGETLRKAVGKKKS